MSYALLSLLITLALGQTAASAIKHLQKAPVLQQGVQQPPTLLSRQQPACFNLLDANELHGVWAEGASEIKAGRLFHFLDLLHFTVHVLLKNIQHQLSPHRGA